MSRARREDPAPPQPAAWEQPRVELFDQTALALAYGRRTGADVRLPRWMLDRALGGAQHEPVRPVAPEKSPPGPCAPHELVA